MKKLPAFLCGLFMLSSAAFATIVQKGEEFFVTVKKENIPLISVNEMIKKGEISKIKIYGSGSVHLISFAKKDSPERLYSVDEKGFIYSIEPFSKYTVSNVDKDGKFQFKEVPKRKYVIDAKGFFFY